MVNLARLIRQAVRCEARALFDGNNRKAQKHARVRVALLRLLPGRSDKRAG